MNDCELEANGMEFGDTGTVADVGKSLIVLDNQKKELSKQLDFVKSQIAEKASELLIMMQNEQIDKISVMGKSLFPKVNLYASLNKAEKPQAMKWLSDNGYGELIQKTVNSRTLSSTVKGIIADGDVVPENLFNVNEVTTVGIRKA